MSTPTGPPPPPLRYQSKAGHGSPLPGDDQVPHRAAGDPSGAARPWYRKKRFIVPILFVLFVGWLGSLGDDEPASTADTAAAAQESTPAEQPTAEEIAAQEAQEAEAERVRQEQEAAEAEAERIRQEQEAAAASEAAAAAAAEEAARGTVAQQNAFRAAENYLDFSAFSRSGLIGQLEFEGFSTEDATFAVNRLETQGGVDWNAEAAESAKNYLEFSSFSRAGLIDQLRFEGFAPEQAEHGVSTTGL